MKTVALLSGMGLLLLLGAILGHESPAVEIHNRGDEEVESFALRVGPDQVASGSLSAGALDPHLVPVRHEGALRLDLRFASGREASFDAGWFSPAQSGPTRIAILSADSVAIAAW